MSNSYIEACTILETAEGAAPKIAKAFRNLTAAFDRADKSEAVNYPYGASGDGSEGYEGLSIEQGRRDNTVIVSSEVDCGFNDELFVNFIGTCIKAGWFLGSVGIEVAMYESSLSPDSFGGYYLRVLPNGTPITVTTSLNHVSDEDLVRVSGLIG